jgi:hypothetical protein
LIRKNNEALIKLRKQVEALKPVLAKQVADRDASQGQLNGIRGQLEGQRQQETALLAQIEAIKKSLLESRGLYQLEITKLSEGL